MSELSVQSNRRAYLTLFIPTNVRSCFQLLYLVFSFNIFFFLIVYHRLIVIAPLSSTTSLQSNHLLDDDLLTAICPIPRFDPWDETVSKSIRIKPLYRCPTQKRNVIHVINYTQLSINQTVNRTYFSGLITHCVYLKIDRNPEEKSFRDWSYTLSDPILMTKGNTKPILDVDFVLTRCYNDRKNYFHGDIFCGYKCENYTKMSSAHRQSFINRTLVYEYVHPIFHLKKPPFSHNARLQRKSSNLLSKLTQSPRSPPSVLMIILDAVSDLQAKRALPRTLAYLKSLGLYTFQRHAVVGDGTFENMVPMLFGKPAADLLIPNTNDSRYQFLTTETKIHPKTKNRTVIKTIVHYPGPYDEYSFIVKNFSKLNYTTYFSEEWRESAFYNLKNGFRQAPTDFYLRPYWLSVYETLSYNKFAGNSNPKPCYLDKLLHFLSLDWLKQFLNLHHKTPNYPTFGIMKMNEMSHDYLERLFWIDYDLKDFFKHLVDQHLLDNTIVLFCGDHGHRQHHLRLTRVGSFEVKLPFFSMLMPRSFKKDFPQAIENLKKNQEMLTSWWDVYETLANILKMVEEPQVSDPLLVNWRPTTSGLSLFHPIPERNCSIAGIPEKYCPCSRTIAVEVNESIIKDLTAASIDYINNIKLKNHTHLCMTLKLKTIIRAEVEKFRKPYRLINNTITTNFTHTYTMLFEVSPSDGIFESRFLYDEVTKQNYLHSELLRINLYGQSSACIQDKYDLRSFCYCISYHKRAKNAQQKKQRRPLRLSTKR